MRRVRDTDRTLPCGTGVGGSAEPAELAGKKLRPKLVLEAVTHAAWSSIESEPFLVPAVRAAIGRPLGPRLSAISGAPDVATIVVHQQAEIEESAGLVGVGYRVAAENIVLQNAGERPVDTGVGGITIAGLPEVGRPSVELPPADRHFVAICRVN